MGLFVLARRFCGGFIGLFGLARRFCGGFIGFVVFIGLFGFIAPVKFASPRYHLLELRDPVYDGIFVSLRQAG